MEVRFQVATEPEKQETDRLKDEEISLTFLDDYRALTLHHDEELRIHFLKYLRPFDYVCWFITTFLHLYNRASAKDPKYIFFAYFLTLTLFYFDMLTHNNLCLLVASLIANNLGAQPGFRALTLIVYSILGVLIVFKTDSWTNFLLLLFFVTKDLSFWRIDEIEIPTLDQIANLQAPCLWKEYLRAYNGSLPFVLSNCKFLHPELNQRKRKFKEISDRLGRCDTSCCCTSAKALFYDVYFGLSQGPFTCGFVVLLSLFKLTLGSLVLTLVDAPKSLYPALLFVVCVSCIPWKLTIKDEHLTEIFVLLLVGLELFSLEVLMEHFTEDPWLIGGAMQIVLVFLGKIETKGDEDD